MARGNRGGYRAAVLLALIAALQVSVACRRTVGVSESRAAEEGFVSYDARPFFRFSAPSGLTRGPQGQDDYAGRFESMALDVHYRFDRARPDDPPMSNAPANTDWSRPVPEQLLIDGLPAWTLREETSDKVGQMLEFRELAGRGYSDDARLRISMVARGPSAAADLQRLIRSIRILPGRPFERPPSAPTAPGQIPPPPEGDRLKPRR